MSVEEQLRGFAEDLEEMLNPQISEDEKVIQKGLMLYRQGMVSHLRMEDTTKPFTATVQDVIPVKVELNMAFPSLSECSCPTDGICRHITAAFFAAYARIDSVSDWVEKWRTPAKQTNQLAQWGIQRAKDLVRANGILKPDYSRWVEMMEDSFDSIIGAKKYSSPYAIVELFKVYERRIQSGVPFEKEWQPLYELIANVVSFRKLAVLCEEMGHEEEAVRRTYLHLFHQMMDDAEELAAQIGQRPLPFDFDQFIEKFPADASKLLTCIQGLEYERIYFYRMLWTDFFKKKAWREAESERIRVLLKDVKEWENPLPLIIASIHLHLLLENDERALKMIDALEEQYIVPYLLYWVEYFSKQKVWKRAGMVIESLVAKLRRYFDSAVSYQACLGFSRLVLKAIAPYCAETGRSDLYERALMQALPYSFHDYEQLLFSRGDYDRWSELFSLVGIPYGDVPKDRIKLVEKEQPEVLFGLLHQTVHQEIEMKNRSSYKSAVRHLKKLRTLYKKMKRMDDWEFFLYALLEKTRRLRAFHEECKRSKLIDA